MPNVGDWSAQLARALFILIGLHLLFGAVWIGAILAFPGRIEEPWAFLLAVPGGLVALFGPTVLAVWRGWLD